MILQGLVFYLFAGVSVFSAAMVITARNPVHSVLFLVLAFFNASGLFVLLGAEFLAMLLVIVYVGAVAVLFLFVVMMLDINFVELRQGFLEYLPMGLLVAAILLVELILVFGGWVVAEGQDKHFAAPTPADINNTEALGELIYTHYIYLFQGAGIVLLIAMIGAIVLTHRRRPGVRRQKVADQVARRPEEVLEVRKVESGKGI